MPATVIQCHVCSATAARELPAYRTLRRVTSDCRPWHAGGRLFICDACGAVQKPVDAEFRREADEIYAKYAIYRQGGGAEQATFEQGSGAASSRSDRLLRALKSRGLLAENGRALDVGCGNGAMLRALSAIAPRWSLIGTELDDKYRREIESIANTGPLHVGPPDQVAGSFDLVSLIHVLEHIFAPAEFLASLRKKLSPDGLLFVELPDHSQNPFELLIADHCTHFTMATAKYRLQLSGYRVVEGGTDWVPKEISLVARAAGGVNFSPPAVSPAAALQLVEAKLGWLDEVVRAGKQLAAAGPIGLFGTSIAGSWLFAELSDDIAFFVDEDPNRTGTTYLGRTIYHPNDAPRGSRVFVGLPPKIADGICRRLNGWGADYVAPPSA